MSSSIGENQKIGGSSSITQAVEAKKETAIDVIHRLFPDMTDFPLTEELAYKYMSWSAVPYLLRPIFRESAMNKSGERHRGDQEHIDQFKKIIEDLYVILEPEERLLPKENLIDKLFEKYRDTYVNNVSEELQALLDQELADHSHGSLAQMIYEKALPILKKDVSHSISAGRSIYPKYAIREFLNIRGQA